MRLIDADELKKSGFRLVHVDNLKPKQSCKSWAEVPTAYDVEKVVEQLLDDYVKNGGMFLYEEVFKTVRKGGVE